MNLTVVHAEVARGEVALEEVTLGEVALVTHKGVFHVEGVRVEVVHSTLAGMDREVTVDLHNMVMSQEVGHHA